MKVSLKSQFGKNVIILMIINLIIPGAFGSSAYTNIISSDYSYLARSNITSIKQPIDMLLHFSRTETPKYTVVLYNIYASIKLVKRLSTNMYVHLIRHLDHYDREFSDNVQFIIPNFYPNVRTIVSSLGRRAQSSLYSGTLPEEKYVETVVASIAFINNSVRRGIISSYDKIAFYGNCVGGLIASATSLGLKKHAGVVVLNGSSLFMPDIIGRRIARKTALKSVKFLLIHSRDDHDIPFVHAENTHNALVRWGADSQIYAIEGANHLDTMIKHKYTGFRFIASVMLKRPEIYRPFDTENFELLLYTKRRMNPEDIEPIVPPRNLTNCTSIDNIFDKPSSIITNSNGLILTDEGAVSRVYNG